MKRQLFFFFFFKGQLLLWMGAYPLAQQKLRKRESAHFSSIYICTTHTHTHFININYDWFELYGRNQHNIVKQLSSD